MTSVIHHGAPGSYKTFSIVQNVLIDALKQGRLVITNIRGFDSLDQIKTNLGIDLPPSASIWYLEPDDEGFKTMAKFFHWAPAGALIAMDEGQRIYPTRHKRFDELDLLSDVVLLDQFDQPLVDIKTGQSILRPRTVENAFDQHRHFNWDIYISTPNISKIHKEIRHVCEWAFRHRNNTGLLPWYKNTWTEFRHDPENNGKSISHYSGSPKRYRAKAEFFKCYQSTATGTAKDSNENISIFRDSRLRFLLVVIVCCLSYLVYALLSAYDRVKAKNQPVVAPVEKVLNQSPGVSVPARVYVNAGQAPVAHDVDVDPMIGVTIYFTGSVNNQLFFELKFPDKQLRILSVNYDDLRYLGFRLTYRSSSFVTLQRFGKVFYAFQKSSEPPSQRAGATGEHPSVDWESGIKSGLLANVP